MLRPMRGTLAQSRLVVLARAVAERFRMDEIDTHAAALAYQLFLSTLAVSIAGLAILGLVARHSSVEVPAGAEEQWQNLIDGGVWLGLVALGGLLVTASGFGRRATRALAAVFRTGPVAGATGYARGLAVALGVIVLVGAVPIVTGILATLQAVGGLEVSGRVLGFGTTVALEFGLFLLAYVALTRSRPVGLRSSDARTSERRTEEASKKSTSVPSVAPADAAIRRYCGVATLTFTFAAVARPAGAKAAGDPFASVRRTSAYAAESKAKRATVGLTLTFHPPRTVSCWFAPRLSSSTFRPERKSS